MGKRRAAESQMSEALLRSQLIERMPEIASSMPKVDTMHQITVNGDGTSAVMGLVSQLMHVFERRNGKS